MAWGKTECQISRNQFNRLSHNLLIDIEGSKIEAKPTEFSTGSFGFQGNGQKITLNIGGTLVKCQVNLNLIVIGSKELSKTPNKSMDLVKV